MAETMRKVTNMMRCLLYCKATLTKATLTIELMWILLTDIIFRVFEYRGLICFHEDLYKSHAVCRVLFKTYKRVGAFLNYRFGKTTTLTISSPSLLNSSRSAEFVVGAEHRGRRDELIFGLRLCCDLLAQILQCLNVILIEFVDYRATLYCDLVGFK